MTGSDPHRSAVAHRGVMIILDGLGDRPAPCLDGRTPLEAAHTPVLDRLLESGQCGQMDPLFPGMPVDTHSGVGALLGLDLSSIRRLARGPVEAAGVGLDLRPGDVALRCNFATLCAADDAGGDGGVGLAILDRRAGRISAGADDLAAVLRDVPLGDGITGTLAAGTHHRAILRLSGPGLSAGISDTDPGASNPSAVLKSRPLTGHPGDARAARAVNRFVRAAFERLSDHEVNRERAARGEPPANGVITRSAGLYHEVRSIIPDLGLETAVVAAESTIHGLARLCGFTSIRDPRFTAMPDTDVDAKVSAALLALDAHELCVVHVKGPDISSHDLDPDGKRVMLERIDAALAPLLDTDLAIAVCSDHSTDSTTGRHCGDPVPVILSAPRSRRDACTSFSETECMRGGLARIGSRAFLLSLLDAMGALANFRTSDDELVRSS